MRGIFLERLTSLGGLVLMLGIALALGRDRRRISLRLVLAGLGLQFVFALLVLRTAAGRAVFEWVRVVFDQLVRASDAGASFLFGKLVSDELGLHAQMAFHALPIIIFFSALAGILYHLGVTQLVVRGMARAMQKTMDTSGAESLACALFVFLGIEATTAIAEYIRRMTRSELFTLMTGFMATIAGSVMAVYANVFKADLVHLLTASVISAPAAIVVSKIMLPETEEPLTRGRVRFQPPREAVNVIDAAARGAGQGLGLALNIAAMLIAFVGLVALVNLGLGAATRRWMSPPLSLQQIFGYAFSPLALAMGVPWDDALQVGRLLGTKTVLNEWLAYSELKDVAATLSPRSVVIATYALCGFSNFGSVAILIGGLSAIDPDRKGLIARLALWSLVSGTLACFMTACVAGILT